MIGQVDGPLNESLNAKSKYLQSLREIGIITAKIQNGMVFFTVVRYRLTTIGI
jgi:hypothetical protein